MLTASYRYDALGRRVRVDDGSGGHDFIYDLSGHPIISTYGGEYWDKSEIFAGSWHIATYTGTTTFPQTDHLGTHRVRLGADGSPLQTCTSYAFGDGLVCTPDSLSYTSPAHFTGQPHDAESNLDHFWFRQYASTQGRWMSPDPAGLAAVDLSNPQSLNRYAYALNSPANYIDPLGLNPANPDDWYRCGRKYPDDMIAYAHCVNDEPAGGGIDGSVGGSGWGPPIIWIPIGGGSGGGTGGSTPPASSGPNTGGLPPMGGETLGIPNGFPMGGLSTCQLTGLCPISPGCDFGVCGFQAGTITWGTRIATGIRLGVSVFESLGLGVLNILVMQKGDGTGPKVRYPEDLQKYGCQPGRTISYPATGRDYRVGTVHEQEYTCSFGTYTVQWIEVGGRVKHRPHVRPGPPKGPTGGGI